MAVDVETLLIRLEATQTKFERQMARANKTASNRARNIENRFKSMNKNVGASLRGVGTALASAFTIRSAQRFLDANTRIENSLKVAGLEGENLAKVYDRLFMSAQRNAAPLEALTSLYGRAALVQKELSISSEDLLRFTDNVAVALRVSGRSAQESSGALLQLSQALGSGIVRAEEFNSILEGALPIAQAAAAGLDEAGGSVAKLRSLVVDGKVSSEAFFKAFEAGSVILQDKVAKAEFTVSQGFTRLTNVIIRAAGEFDEGSNASGGFAKALEQLSKEIDSIDFSSIGEQFSNFINWAGDAKGAWEDFFFSVGRGLREDYGHLFGVDDSAVNPRRGARGASRQRINNTNRLDAAFSDKNDPAVNPGLLAQLNGNSKVSTVSLKDFKLPSTKKKKKKSTKKKDPFADEVAEIKERTAALQEEAQVLALLNPELDNQQFALDKLRAQRELLNAAQESGIEITDEVRASIEGLAEGYAIAEKSISDLAESQENLKQQQQDLKDSSKEFTKGLISDLRSGVSASDALENALDRLLDKLLDLLSQDLPSGKGGNPFADIFSAIFGGIGGSPIQLPSVSGSGASLQSFEGGGSTGKGVRAGGVDGKGGYYAIVHPNEEIIDTTRFSNTLGSTPKKGGGSGSNVEVKVINNSGSEVTQERGNRGGVDFVDIVIGEVNKALSSGKMDGSLSGRFNGMKPSARRTG